MAGIVDADYSAERFAVDGTKSMRIGTGDKQTHACHVELVHRSKIDAVARSVQSWQDFVEAMPLRLRVGWSHAKCLRKPQSCLAASFRTGQSCHSRTYTTCPEPSQLPDTASFLRFMRRGRGIRFRYTVACFSRMRIMPSKFQAPRGAPPGSPLREQRSEYQTEKDFVPLRRSQIADLTCPCRAVRLSCSCAEKFVAESQHEQVLVADTPLQVTGRQTKQEEAVSVAQVLGDAAKRAGAGIYRFAGDGPVCNGDRIGVGVDAGDGTSGRHARDGDGSQPQAGRAAPAGRAAHASVVDGAYGFRRATGRMCRVRLFSSPECGGILAARD